MHGVRTPECLGAALGHADVVEKALFDERLERFDRLLDGDDGVDTGTLEEVNALLTSQSCIASGHRAQQIFWPYQERVKNQKADMG